MFYMRYKPDINTRIRRLKARYHMVKRALTDPIPNEMPRDIKVQTSMAELPLVEISVRTAILTLSQIWTYTEFESSHWHDKPCLAYLIGRAAEITDNWDVLSEDATQWYCGGDFVSVEQIALDVLAAKEADKEPKESESQMIDALIALILVDRGIDVQEFYFDHGYG